VVGAVEKRIWILVTVVGAIAAAAAVAHAAIPGAGGVIHACYKSNGDLKVVDEAEACGKNETRITWAQQGVQGPPGPQGPAGPTGPAGPGSLNSAAMATSGPLRPLPWETGVTLRAGTYMVWAVVEYYNDNSSSGFNSQCSFWRDFVGFDAGGTFISGIGDSAIFSGKDSDHGQVVMMATATLPADGSILLHCSDGLDPDIDAEALGRLFTLKVDGIN
jgi:hypothetical protein